MEKNLAVVLLSSGMDSAVCATLASQTYQLAFLHIQYGQKAEKKELEYFLKLCDFFKPLKIFIAKAYFLKEIGGSSLTNNTLEIPNSENSEIPSTYVPFRNGIFLSIATSWAEVIGAKKIFIGVNEVDFSGYPDCREIFIKTFNEVIRIGTKPETQIEVVAPLLKLNKKEIIELGIKLGTPFHLTWSCYKGEEVACGECSSCQLRLKAFKALGLQDPLPYATKNL
ncbi:MAG: 7-cyano-7-deazaguanine synthase QueC [Thermodesulfobacteriaceae bacterium]|nr:7-cyano-7-deazaguanine synthase QueC [Thermodesulfobacteriaceae bacterium]MDW8136196.1 7-cyano-7-deazaguanine synthase QueC [Thermodesulfobacterium sp.]